MEEEQGLGMAGKRHRHAKGRAPGTRVAAAWLARCHNAGGRAHDTALVGCRTEGFSMIVTVRATVLSVAVERTARAGPPGAREVRTRAPCVWCG